MSNAQDRLSRLRRDLHVWKDALDEIATKYGNSPCIRASDVVTGIDAILDADQARIGKTRDQWD